MRRLLALVVGLATAAVVLLALNSGDADRPDLSEPPTASGAGTSSLTIAPVRAKVTGDTDEAQVRYTLANTTTRDATYDVSTSELSADGQPLESSPASASGWATPQRTSVRVPAEGSATVDVRVRPPADRGADERRIGVSFTDAAATRGGGVGVRTRVTTSLYVEGTGRAVRDVRLSSLDIPTVVGSGDVSVRARLSNEGTTVVVPDARPAAVVGTTTGAPDFALSGDVARPGEMISVVGTAANLPVACWCEVRVSATSGDGQVSSVSGRVLVMPWWLLGAAVALVAVIGVLVLRRRSSRASSGAVGDAAARLIVAAAAAGAVLAWPSTSFANETSAPVDVGATVTEQSDTAAGGAATSGDRNGALPGTGGPGAWLLALGAGLVASGGVLLGSRPRRI